MLVPLYGEICEKNEYSGEKECAAYHVFPYLLVSFGQFLDYHGGAVTAAATVVIGWFTWTIGDSSRAQLRHTRQIERAYLSAMGPLALDPAGKPVHYTLEVSNNGKTAGRLLEIAVEYRSLSKVQQRPEYLDPGYKRVPYRRDFYPGERETKLSFYTYPDDIPDPFVYGRLWYEDIWGEKHISSFLIKIESGGTTVQVNEPNVHPEYYRWD